MNNDRRRFLRGAGGVVLGLPMLDAFRPRGARAAAAAPKIVSFFFVQQNGFAQQDGSAHESDLFLPTRIGALTTAGMMADSGRATSELAAYASKLNIVSGLKFAYSPSVCGHFRGCAQVLTAAALSERVPFAGRSQMLPLSESIDSRIAREATPGREPLVVHADRYNPIRYVSWRGPKDVRSSEGNPFAVYQKLIGISTTTDPKILAQIKARRAAVNDFVRQDMTALRSRTDLSAEDRRRLDLHFTSIREIEIKLTGSLDAATVKAIGDIDGKQRNNAFMQDVVKLHMDIAAFGFAADAFRTGALMTGGAVTYDIDGYNLNGVVPTFHQISHRILSDGAVGPALPDAQKMHSRIDRIHANYFKHLLDRLSAYTVPEGGTLFDRSVSVWTNEIAAGVNHSASNVPFIIAGNANGYLKTGQYMKLASAPHNKLLATLLNAAVGRSKSDPLLDFGDPTLEKGLVSEILS